MSAPAHPAVAVFDRSRADGVCVISVRGELDVGSAPMLREWLEVARDQGDARLVLDLSQLRFIDVAALTVLLDAQEELLLEGRTMMVVCGRPWIRRVFSVTGAGDLLPVVSTRHEAMGIASQG